MIKEVKYLFGVILMTFFVFNTSAQPANDACVNAINIPIVSNFCSSNGGGTNVNATDDVATSGGFGAATCWAGGTVHDVWYSFTAIASDVTIVINGNQGSPTGGTLNRPQVTLYGGTCGGTLNELVCASAPSGQNIIQLYRGGLTIGQTYIIRVDGFNTNRGTFQYCINNYNPVPTPSGDCQTAVALCDKSSFSVPSVSGAGTNNTEMNGAACFNYTPSTGNVETSSTWYAFTFATSGTFTFNIAPSNPNDDIDFVVYRLPSGIGNCSGKVTVRCEAASCYGATGLNTSASDVSEDPGCSFPSDNYLRQLTVTAGETYVIGINNFTSTGNGFNISFGGTAQIQGPTAIINDNDADDNICAGDAITFTDASTPPPLGSITNWTWSFGVGASPATSTAQFPPAVTYSSAGTKTITLTVRSDKGCLITTTKTITVNQPVPVITSSNAAICVNDTRTLTGTPAGGTFSVLSGPGTITGNTLTATAAGSIQIQYNATIAGCSGTATQTISSAACACANPPTVSLSSSSGSTCGTTAVTINGNTFGGSATTVSITENGAGSVSAGTANSSPFSFTYTPAAGDAGNTVTITVTTNNPLGGTCTAASASYTLTVNARPAPVISSSNTALCGINDTRALSATPAGGTFSVVSGPGTIVGTTLTSTGIGTIQIQYSVTIAGCTGTTTQNIAVNPIPAPAITSSSTNLCVNAGRTLTGTPAGGTFSIISGPGTITGSALTANGTGNIQIQYSVTVGGCSASTTQNITTIPNPVPVFTSSNAAMCATDTRLLTATPTGGSFSIINGPGTLSGNTLTATAAGTLQLQYSVTVAGCTGMATQSITVNPLPVINITSSNAPLCVSATRTLTATPAGGTFSIVSGPGTISGSTLTVTGTGPIQVQYSATVSGCSASKTQNITVNPIPAPAITSSNVALCVNETMVLSATPAGGTFSIVSGPGTISGSVLTATGVGSIQIQYSLTTAGCTGTTTQNINTNPSPVAVITSSNSAMCLNDTKTLTATPSGGTFSVISGPGTISGSSLTATGAGTIQIQYSITIAGCTSVITQNITSNPLPVIRVNSPTVCTGKTAILTASGGSVYTWSGGLGSGNPITTPILNAPVTYTVTGTDVNGCIHSATSSISIRALPMVTVNSTTICTGQKATLTASGANSYSWSGGLGSGNPKTTPVINSASTYTVTGTDLNGCTNTATSTISLYPLPLISVNAATICKGDTARLTASGALSYSWDSGDTLPSVLFNPASTRNYIVTGIDANGCKNSATAAVTVLPLPAINAVAEKPKAKYQEEIQLDVITSGTLSYNWSPASAVNDPQIKNPVTVVTSSTLFTVLVKDNNNCTNRDTVLVELIDECQEEYIFAPTGFSPNGDRINDCFSIISPPLLSEFSMIIFNRWGEKVFETRDEKDCWNGTYEGSVSLSDSYIYIISFKCYNGKSLSKKGTITLLN